MNRFQLCLVALAGLALAAVGAVPTAGRGDSEQLCQCRPIASPKIVGGSIVQDDVTYPWMASFGGPTVDIFPKAMKSLTKMPKDEKKMSHACGAIILDKDYVLTAAHCVQSLDVLMKAKPSLNISLYGVGFGKSLDAIYDAGRIPITEVHVHPNYASPIMEKLKENPTFNRFSYLFGNVEFDFAILKLSRSLQLSSEHGLLPACLESMDKSYYYEPLSTIGYGALLNKIDLVSMVKDENLVEIFAGNELKKLNLQTLSMNISTHWFAKALGEVDKIFEDPMFNQSSNDLNKFHEQRMHSWEEMIWASAASDEPVPSSICQGDEGGPLMYQDGGITKVVGIASNILTGMDGMTYITCDDKAFFAKIYNALPWIREIVHGDLCLA